MPAMLDEAPFVNLADPELSIRSKPIKDARQHSWYALTPYGIAVLRYPDMRNLLLHKSLRQGSHAWPAHNKVTGIFADWWARTILVQEGADHARLRKLVNPAFAPKVVAGMRPEFDAMALELAETFVGRGECDFMTEFADPYAARILCHILGLPREEADHVLRSLRHHGARARRLLQGERGPHQRRHRRHVRLRRRAGGETQERARQ